MASRDRDRGFRELIGSEDYRRKLRKQLSLEDARLPPKLAALALELQEAVQRRDQQWAEETAAALVPSTASHLFMLGQRED